MVIPIDIPPVDTENYVEVNIVVNGHKREFKYRLEVFRWRDWCKPAEERVEGLKRMIEAYDKNWQLMQIGMPTETVIPLMFRQAKLN
jgi:hypothetical protein